MKEIKQKLLLFSLGIIFLTSFAGQVSAEGGTGTIIGGGDGVISGTSSTYHDCGIKKNGEMHGYAYKIELVYKPKDASRYTLASLVVLVKSNSSNYTKSVKTYAKSNKVTVHNVITEGPLYELAKQIKNGKTAESLTNSGWLKKYLPAEKWRKYFKVSEKDLAKEHMQGPKFSAYGYRLIVQQLTSWCQNGKITAAYPRKEMANDKGKTANGDGDYMGKGHPSSYQGDIQTQQSDIGIHAAKGSYGKNTRSNFGNMDSGKGYYIFWFPNSYSEAHRCKQVGKTPQCKIQKYNPKTNKWTDVKTNFDCNGQTSYTDSKGKKHEFEACPTPQAECAESDLYGTCKIKVTVGKYSKTETTDCNNAAGTAGKTSYNGITLNPNCPFKPKWNYDIDAACENCDSTTTGGSYQVQDVVDWEAVLHSLERNDKPYLQQYYNKGGGILCKEAFNVVFPNDNNVRNIHIEPGRYFTVNEKGPVYINGVYNFEPIKVTRTRQCISTNTNAAAAQAALTSFSNKSNINNLGTISLKYTEKYSGSKYNTTQTLIADQTRIKNYDKQFSTTTVAGQTYQILTDNTEGYFKIKDDNLYRYISIQNGLSQTTKPADTSKYIDVEKPNLPISLKNEQGVTTELYYELPSDSKLAEAVSSNKANYLEDKPTYDNVYRRGINASETACAKMYGLNSAKYNSCVNERKGSKTADITAANKCLVGLGPNAKFQYICNITPTDKTEENCYEIPSSKDSNNRTFICKDGSVCDEATYNGTNYKAGVSCDVKKCTVVGNKYYGPNGEEISKEDYEKICPAGLKCDLDCPECGYCCPDTTMMCAVKGADGVCGCPGKGNKIIYRPIDLTNPFPGQTNYQRATGSNWCTSLANGKTTCKNTNAVVTRDITSNRSTANEGVYNLEPLYEVELNAANIEEIRKYNSNKNYEDFTLTCQKGTCMSNFLRERSSNLKLSGVCNTENFDELRNCAERGRS